MRTAPWRIWSALSVRRALAVAIALSAWAGAATAEDRSWEGPAAGNWFTSSYWDPAGTPAAADHLAVTS